MSWFATVRAQGAGETSARALRVLLRGRSVPLAERLAGGRTPSWKGQRPRLHLDLDRDGCPGRLGQGRGELNMQSRGRVVIIGAGIAGASVAYHLAQRGWKDIVVVDRGPLYKTGGSTSHAPGLVFQVNFSRMMSVFARETTRIYGSLNPSGGERLWSAVGGLEVAWTPERYEDLKRKVGAGRAWGLETCLLGPAETRGMVPLLSEAILGAMYTPGDGVARAWKLAAEMGRRAEECGAATFHGNTTVTAIDVVKGRVNAVRTSRGVIRTEAVVCAAGIWGRLIGRMAGVELPLAVLRHQYAVTAPLPQLSSETMDFRDPIIRHQDRAAYFRQHHRSYIIGSYDHEPMLVEPGDIGSPHGAQEMPSMMPWSDSAFRRGMIAAAELLPALRGVKLTRKVNGMFIFTPDGMPVLGEAPQARGFWSAEAVWITHAGGVGKALADWMADGDPGMDLWEADIARFYPHQMTRDYISRRGARQYRQVYDIIHPQQQMEEPRGLRILPCHQRYEELGARFVENAGWERPQWFEANAALLQGSTAPNHERGGWEGRFWSAIIGAEHRAVRERVGLFDLTPLTKLEVRGPGALKFLQGVTANQMDRPPGSITYSAMLTPRGGIKCDLTVTRLEDDAFMVVTGAATAAHDRGWMERHRPDDGSVVIRDESSRWCCIGVWGPRARELLRGVSDDDLSGSGFPYLAARRIAIAEIPALALRISYVGELGWEIYAPFESGRRLWDILWEGGRRLGAVAAGMGAFDSLRLEKGYRLWGNDIHTGYNPFEAGIGFAVRMGKGDFIGREALEGLRRRGLTKKLCCMTFDSPDAVVLGKEPIRADGRVAGYVTSANYGYSIGRGIAYGYLPVRYARVGTEVEVEYFGEARGATVSAEPLWDAKMERLRS